MNVLFCDSSHPKSYDFDNLSQQAIGGTESSLLRLAAILAAQQHHIMVYQQARQQASKQRNIHFIGPNQIDESQHVDVIVVLRKDQQLKQWQHCFPKARTLLWLHTYKKWEFVFKRLFKHTHQSVIIGNSKTHAQHLEQQLHEHTLGRFLSAIGVATLPVKYGYNPVPKPHVKTATERDPNKLIFLSAPNKGLTEVLSHFQKVKAAMPDMQLYIANPGYRDQIDIQQPGVHILGALPQAELWQHVAESLCVFYPQTTFAETFGLIYAEANALETPVLAHDIGAAREILHPENPLIDCHNTELVIKTLQQWQEKLPAVKYREIFANATIYQQWSELLKT
ncbi:glycosyltransferase [Marinicella gelatinilytica]|uniref:glycosyltransferase n=1 Tax=Marinicella gelatinilytica TaxID=2996017 RepID=UPI002260DC0A|nr:glycosyltransferase [Marinicella gelatinilytica]MCX7546130.1 glycosyltransferase [Marinicella gelatinilytica]